MEMIKEEIMKKLLISITVLMLVASCTESGRIDQIDPADYVPQQVTITSVRRVAGGAIIKYALPDDINLRGVRAEYNRSGEDVYTQVSKYVDSLKVEGYSDTQTHTVQIYGIGKNGRKSAPLSLDITPGQPTIQKIRLSLSETFGGVRLIMQGNEDNESIAMTILKDDNVREFGMDPSEMTWDEVFTYYTNGQEVAFTRYGLDDTQRIYGICARDRWMNYSDTTYFLLTPYLEEELENSFWRIYNLPGDETDCLEGKYQFTRLFDGKWSDNNGCAGFTRGLRFKQLTIDMGYTATFSRMRLQPRGVNQSLSSGFTPWRWQIWGSMAPNPDGSMDDSWYLLGDFTQYKPSGLAADGSFGVLMDEDTEYFVNNNDYEFAQTDKILDPQRETRFIRLVMLDSYNTYFNEFDDEPTNVYYLIGELMMWGQKRD
jgi:hypothetical protein